MSDKNEFKFNVNEDGGYYPVVRQNGVSIGELLCPVPACVNQENSVSQYQHLMGVKYEHDSVDDPNFDHHRPDRAVISFHGECGHEWELTFESYKGYTDIQIVNVKEWPDD